MKMHKAFNTHNAAALLVVSLVVLPSCGLLDWVKDKMGGDSSSSSEQMGKMPTDGSPVIVSMNGKPLITRESLQQEKNDLLESNPQLKQMIAMMDEKQLDRNIAEGLTNQAIVSRYIADNNIKSNPEYLRERTRMLKSIDQVLDTKYFMQGLKCEVTDADLRKCYEENKEAMPQLLLSRGGTQLMYVAFDKESAANDFVEKVRQNKSDLERAAKEAGMTDKVKDMKLVHQYTGGLDKNLREAATGVKKVPSTQVVKLEDGKYAVASMTSKEEPKYRPFDQAKAELAQLIEREKRTEAFEKEINSLKTRYNVALDEGYFAEQEAPQSRVADQAMEKEIQEQGALNKKDNQAARIA